MKTISVLYLYITYPSLLKGLLKVSVLRELTESLRRLKEKHITLSTQKKEGAWMQLNIAWGRVSIS